MITLAVIGVVAALTIPSLMALIGTKVTENQQKVFQAKLIQGLNLAKTSGDLANNFTSTEDFLRNGLARHYKMAAICGADNLRDCIPYENITYMDGDTEKTVKVADLKTAESIKIDKDGFEDTAAFITADGIPVLLTYNKKCIVDTEQADREISSCVAGIYDISGTKGPNKYAFTLDDDGKTVKAYTYDVRTFNGAGVGESFPEINGVKIVKSFMPNDDSIYSTMGSLTYVPTSSGDCGSTESCPDYWLTAKLYCESNSASLPSTEQLAKIAMVLFNNNGINTGADYSENTGSMSASGKDAVYEALGISADTPHFFLWSNLPSGDTQAKFRWHYSGSTGFYWDPRSNGAIRGICVR